MLTAHSSLGFDPVITNLRLLSLYEANYAVSNIQIGSANLFFDQPLPGDYDEDNDVDGFDLLKWQRGESTHPLSPSDLADWEANCGTVASPITAASTAVPEPSTSIMLLLGLATGTHAGIVLRRR
jgi:hypothetical protein